MESEITYYRKYDFTHKNKQNLVWRGQVRPTLAPPSGGQVASHSFESHATLPAVGARARPGRRQAGRRSGASRIANNSRWTQNPAAGESNLLKLHTRRRRRGPNPS